MPTYSQVPSDGAWNNALHGKIRRTLRGVFKDSSFLMPKTKVAWLLFLTCDMAWRRLIPDETFSNGLVSQTKKSKV